MRTVDVLLRGFNDCEHAQFRSWRGVVLQACAQYMVYHREDVVLFAVDPSFTYLAGPYVALVRRRVHICKHPLTKSEMRTVNDFLVGIGCVNRFKLVGTRIGVAGERKIEPIYPISWITYLG